MSIIEKNKWLCSSCRFVLGFVDGKTVRIKRKDLFVEIENFNGGTVKETCVRCGLSNILIDQNEDEKNQ